MVWKQWMHRLKRTSLMSHTRLEWSSTCTASWLRLRTRIEWATGRRSTSWWLRTRARSHSKASSVTCFRATRSRGTFSIGYRKSCRRLRPSIIKSSKRSIKKTIVGHRPSPSSPALQPKEPTASIPAQPPILEGCVSDMPSPSKTLVEAQGSRHTHPILTTSAVTGRPVAWLWPLASRTIKSTARWNWSSISPIKMRNSQIKSACWSWDSRGPNRSTMATTEKAMLST